MKRIVIAVATAALVAAAVGAPAAAKSDNPKGPPVGEETGNNLSVPAILVGDVTAAPTLTLPCGAGPRYPQVDGALVEAEIFTDPLYVLDPGQHWWLQKSGVTWAASCAEVASSDLAATSIEAAWGDNLKEGDALAANRPLRVEIALLATGGPADTMTGFNVRKLTDELDRYATYGVEGFEDAAGIFLDADDYVGSVGGPTPRVWDDEAWLTIDQITALGGDVIDPDHPVYDDAMTAEINSTGAVVYGFNWGIGKAAERPAKGFYRLTFTVSEDTVIDTVNAGSGTDHSATLEINLNNREVANNRK